MKVSFEPYRYKGQVLDRWRVRWSERGTRYSKSFQTRFTAENWIKTQKHSKSQMSGNEMTEWNKIPARERRSILKAKQCLCKIAQQSEVMIWEEAVQLYVERYAKLNHAISFNEAVQKFLEEKRKQRSRKNIGERYLYQLETCLGKLSRTFGSKLLCDITSTELDDWIEDQGWTAKNRNHYLSYLSALYEWAILNDSALPNPISRIIRHKITQEDESVPSPAIVERVFLSAIQKRDYEVFTGLCYGFGLGLRNSEIGKLTWDNVSPEWVRLPAEITKDGNKRIIELQSEFEPVLKMLEKLPRLTTTVVSSEWGKRRLEILRASKVEKTRNVMRSTFASYFFAITESAEKVRKILGHSASSKMLEMNYKAIDLYDGHQIRPITKQDALDYFARLKQVQNQFLTSIG